MPDNIVPIEESSERNSRIKRQLSIIESGGGKMTFRGESITEMFPNGDIETTETNFAKIIEGEFVNQASQIAGKCQEPKCGRWLTHRTIRFCFHCGKVNCVKCCKWDQKEERWTCKRCYRSVLIKRILKGILRVIFFPFVRR